MAWTKPQSVNRAKEWTAEVENLFRFQQAGYRDEQEYLHIKHCATVRILHIYRLAVHLLTLGNNYSFYRLLFVYLFD